MKKAVQIELEVNYDQIVGQTVFSSDGKCIAFIRQEHELVILQEAENSHYKETSLVNDLFSIYNGYLQFIGNNLFWVRINNPLLKVIIIDIRSMKESFYRQNVGFENFAVVNGCLYQINGGNLVVTDFMNECKIQVFQRNYHEVKMIECLHVPSPYLFIQQDSQFWCEPIPIQDNGLFWAWTTGRQFQISQHHIITQQPSINSIKLISSKIRTPSNAQTIYIISVNDNTQITIYKQLMISCDETKITTISRNQTLKILRKKRKNPNEFQQDNYNYLQIYRIDDQYSILDLRTSRTENYEDTKWIAIRQNRIIQFKQYSLLIHIMNT